ncbi:nuclear transport factor 2 family protein [Herbiconiux sp. L3-i23]|uniref:nuclear transport factor 2 family protein n=1 Tax=Herbiconiux sp. L3-i23 TaxID=2905871 RepID=UPI00206E077F|nr:nuclear transport factor 2 family protein [Herbiconiux sp. L3-i23]BDI23055.1 hypothetical protein L3i23_18310 [Herbiconiux sp. L3-i23]
MALETSTLDSVIVVWHVAVNARDADAAAAACAEDVVLGGPEGESRGRGELRRWVEESGIRLMPKEAYDIPGGIVVAQEVTWPGNADRAEEAPQRLYTAFGLRDGEISSILRYESLDEAKAAPIAA